MKLFYVLFESLFVIVLSAMAAVGGLIGIVAVATFWIVLRVICWAIIGWVLGWLFSGHFAVWENRLDMSMSELGAMLGFVSAAFQVKFNPTAPAKKD